VLIDKRPDTEGNPFVEFVEWAGVEDEKAFKDLDESTQIDVDDRGNIRAITIEHASERADLPEFSFEQRGA
jgi:uncharacterized protein YuzE